MAQGWTMLVVKVVRRGRGVGGGGGGILMFEQR